MIDGGWVFDGEKGWKLDPSQAERVRRSTADALARIDARHARLPTCTLCGQRALKLDRFGLCSKISKRHQARRDELAALEGVVQ